MPESHAFRAASVSGHLSFLEVLVWNKHDDGLGSDLALGARADTSLPLVVGRVISLDLASERGCSELVASVRLTGFLVTDVVLPGGHFNPLPVHARLR